MHCSTSGVTDYLAHDDTHALDLARTSISNLAPPERAKINLITPEEPLYDANELDGIVGTDVTKPFEMREVILAN